MFKILFLFITKFIILNPITLLGIGIAGYLTYSYNAQGIQNICSNPVYYGYLYGFSLVYVCLFRHRYKYGTNKVDWWATAKGSVWAFINIIAVAAITFLCIHIYNTFSWNAINNYLLNNK